MPRRALFPVAVIVLAGLVAWLTAQHPLRFDATAQARHSLLPASVEAISALEGAINVEAWLEPAPGVQQSVAQLIARYQQHKPDIHLTFINPVTAPAQAREKSIQQGGELILSWQGRKQRLRTLSEKALTHAFLRLQHESAPVIRFVSGHLERQPDSAARHGYQQFVRYMRSLGYTIETISLITTPVVPQDTDLLVIAAPTGDYFPGESASVLNYLASGGNLLWLLESRQPPIPAELAGELGLSVLPGVIVDVAAQQLAVDTPDFAVIDTYPDHPALPERLGITLFPQAVGLSFPATIGWYLSPILATSQNSWTETGQLAGQIRFNKNSDEVAGPLALGAAFSRDFGDVEQRVIVVGDADFLANSWLGNGSNLYLGQQLFSWLSSRAQLPAIAPLQAADAQLQLSEKAIAILGFTFLVFLPGIFILMAVLTWRKRTA